MLNQCRDEARLVSTNNVIQKYKPCQDNIQRGKQMNYQQNTSHRFRMFPPVVKNLLIINAIFFLATIAIKSSMHIDLTDYLGLHLINASKFQPYQLITYMFMHGGFSHIFFNMFALWMFGKVLEEFWGPKRFIVYYLITGVGAALIHYVVLHYQMAPVLSVINDYIQSPSHEKLMTFINSPNFRPLSYDIQNHFNEFKIAYNNLINNNPAKALQLSADFMSQYKIDFLNLPVVIGASGAVFGLLLAFGMMFPNQQIFIIPIPIPIKAKYFVIFYGIIELYSGISNTPGDNVAHFAHLGGMLFGFILIKYWKMRDKNKNNTIYY